ncbi:MAG: T9SS type A sorting domain-containing protein [Bacteroidetes bacterium]|nr:T9SS type A sorting domain-containing protein [Bacteroidota bacterium]
MQNKLSALILSCLATVFSLTSHAQTIGDWTFLSSVNATKLTMATSQYGIACSLAGSHYTTDGGSTWQSVTGAAGSLVDMAAPSATHLIAISQTHIYVSFDGGSTFVSNGTSGGHILNDVFFINDNRGWVVQDDGQLQITVNGGSTWNDVSVSGAGNATDFQAVSFASSTIGSIGSKNGRIYYTTDGGSTWTQATTPNQLTADYTISSVKYLNTTVALASATSTTHQDGLIVRSTDGGATWTTVQANTSEYITDMDFQDATTGYAVGILFAPRNSSGPELIYKTTDGGQTWTQLNSTGTGGCDFYGISFLNGEGYISGMSCVYKTNGSPATGVIAIEAPAARLYPNPATGVLHISSDFSCETVHYEVSDLSGRMLLADISAKADFDINVAPLSAGMYMMSVTDGSRSAVIKFTKE